MDFWNKQNCKGHVAEFLTEMFHMYGNNDERMVLPCNIYAQLKNIQRKYTIVELQLRVYVEQFKKSVTFGSMRIYFLQNV